MKLVNRETDYALRALVRLSEYPEGEVVPASSLSVTEEIPLAYLRKIMRRLLKAGMVGGREGKGGGYYLKKSPRAISLGRLISAIQGPLRMNRCLMRVDPCPRSRRCAMRGRMTEIESFLRSYLNGITLNTLIAKARRR